MISSANYSEQILDRFYFLLFHATAKSGFGGADFSLALQWSACLGRSGPGCEHFFYRGWQDFADWQGAITTRQRSGRRGRGLSGTGFFPFPFFESPL